jgi:ABC-2 type transport system permease protein
LGTILFYPLMFYAGLWVPRQSMSLAMRHISDYTPLGAGVHAMLSSIQGTFPPTQPLLVMAAWAVVFGVAAVKFFRWE